MGTANQPVLSQAQLAELDKLARAKARSINEVVAQAIDRYIQEEKWDELMRYGQARARELVLTEEDVPRLIAESRQELGR